MSDSRAPSGRSSSAAVEVDLIKLRVLEAELSRLLEAREGQYWRPSYVAEYFTRFIAIRDRLIEAWPEAFEGIPRRPAPNPWPGSDFGGEGFFGTDQLQQFHRDMVHMLELGAGIKEVATRMNASSEDFEYPDLGMQSVGAVRKLLFELTRGGMKQVLIEAGSHFALAIPFADKMTDPNYRTADSIVSEGFDRMVHEAHPIEANLFILEVVRAVARRAPKAIETLGAELETALARDKVALGDMLGHGLPEVSKDVREYLKRGDLDKALELNTKAWSRVDSDPDSAVTAATSSCESVCLAIIERLGLEMPAKKQLPDYVTTIRRQTNFEDLFPQGDRSKAFLRTIGALAGDSYNLSHEAGDRHGSGESSPRTTPEVAFVFVSSVDTLTGLLVRGLTSGRLKRK